MKNKLFYVSVVALVSLVVLLGAFAQETAAPSPPSVPEVPVANTPELPATQPVAPAVETLSEKESTKPKMKKVPEATIVTIPSFRAVASGYMPMSTLFMDDGFLAQVKPLELPLDTIIFECADFLLHNGKDFNWLWAVEDSVTESDVAPYELVDFGGGLYATATCIDNDMASWDAVMARVKPWLESSGFEIDNSRGHQNMTQMIYCLDEVKEGLGYEQLQIYIPIKLR